MAEVYRASSSGAGGFQKQIAIKRILPNYANNEEFRRMFETEARICSSLTHGNIAQVYDFVKNGETLLLAMEFVNGKNLRQYINKTKKVDRSIPIELSVFIINEVCKGLEYAHSKKDDVTGKPQNIIHRDMSPQNIMISYEGAVKIVDFGIAKAKDRVSETRAGVIKGKFGYMSPEQANGESVDHRTDIFSTGIILWELLTGKRLFAAENDLATLKLIQECQIIRPNKLNPNLPPELDKIVMKALTRDLSLRYHNAGSFHRTLQEFLNKNFPMFTQREAGELFQAVFQTEIASEKRRAEQFYNQPIPYSQGSPNDKSKNVEDLDDVLEEGSITKSEQGSMTAVTSEDDLNSMSFEDEPLPMGGNDKTVNANPVETRIEDSNRFGTNSQKTIVGLEEESNIPVERMPSIAESRDFKTQNSSQPSLSKRTPVGSETNAATIAGTAQTINQAAKKETPNPRSKSSERADPPIIDLQDETDSGMNTRRRDRSISIINKMSKQNETDSKEIEPEVKLEEVKKDGRYSRTQYDEEDFFKPEKKQTHSFIYILIFGFLGITGYLYKGLLSGDLLKKLDPPRPTASSNEPTPNTTNENTPSELSGTRTSLGDCVLNFDSDPSGAEIFINNQTRGLTSRSVSVPCNATIDVRLELEGYETKIDRIKSGKNRQPLKLYQLNPVKLGSLIFTVDNTVEMLIDGKSEGTIMANVPKEIRLSARKHKVQFKSSFLGIDKTYDFEVQADTRSQVPMIRLSEPQPKTKRN